MTDSNRDLLKAYIDANIVAGGGTTFFDPLMTALGMMSTPTTGSCMNVVLFLTDGIATFTGSDYDTVSSEADSKAAVIFSYALGSGK